MKRWLLAAIVIAILPTAAPAALVISAPDVTINNSAGSGSVDIVLDVTDVNYDIAAFDLRVELAPRDGATGVTFTNASQPASDFIFTGATTGALNNLVEDQAIYGYLQLDPAGTEETKFAGGSYKLMTIEFDVAPGTMGTFDLLINADWTAVTNGQYSTFSDLSFADGSIGVVPEPATLALLALGAGGMAIRRRRRR